MANHREQIRMTEEEVAVFVDSCRNLQVATLDADGSAHLSTLWFAVVDGRLVFETYTKSQKIVNLRRDPRVTVLLEDGDEYEELRGVMIKGRAVLHDDPADVRRLAREVMVRNQPGIPVELLDGAAARMATKRTAVVVEPERTVSWDHRKLGTTP